MEQVVKLHDLGDLKVSLNQYYSGMHWTKRNKLKDKYVEWFSNFKSAFQPVKRQCEIQFDFYFTSHPLDPDNTVIMAKMITDCMVKSGILANDTRKYIGKVSYSSNKTKENNYVVVRIVD